MPVRSLVAIRSALTVRSAGRWPPTAAHGMPSRGEPAGPPVGGGHEPGRPDSRRPDRVGPSWVSGKRRSRPSRLYPAVGLATAGAAGAVVRRRDVRRAGSGGRRAPTDRGSARPDALGADRHSGPPSYRVCLGVTLRLASPAGTSPGPPGRRHRRSSVTSDPGETGEKGMRYGSSGPVGGGSPVQAGENRHGNSLRGQIRKWLNAGRRTGAKAHLVGSRTRRERRQIQLAAGFDRLSRSSVRCDRHGGPGNRFREMSKSPHRPRPGKW